MTVENIFKNSKRKSTPLDFIVDELTKSIELSATSERFETTILPFEKTDLPSVSQRAGWKFDWEKEFAAGAGIYKLVTKKEPEVIQGLAIFVDEPGFVLMHLLESAPFNVGKGKKFIGVAGNLVAFGCLLSRKRGFQSVLAFKSKTVLMEHYQKSLGARPIGNQRMAIFEAEAADLINRYFPNATPQGELE